MEYVIFILDALALIVLATLAVVEEKDRHIVKFIVAVILGISMLYNINYICACGRSFLGKCSVFRTKAKSSGTEMKSRSMSQRHREAAKKRSPLAEKGVDEGFLFNPFA